MRLFGTVIIAGTLLLTIPVLCYAQNGKQARELFVKAIALEEEGNSAKESGDNATALQKHQEALAGFEQIKAQFPQWQAMSLVDLHVATTKQSIFALKHGSVAKVQADIDTEIRRRKTAAVQERIEVTPAPASPADQILDAPLLEEDMEDLTQGADEVATVEEPQDQQGSTVIKLRGESSRRRKSRDGASSTRSKRSTRGGRKGGKRRGGSLSRGIKVP